MAQSPRRKALTLACGLVAASVTVLGGLAATPAGAATGNVLSVPGAKAVPGSYIVILRDDVTARSVTPQTAAALTQKYGGSVRSTWTAALHGFSAWMSEAQARSLAADPRVSYVQADAEVHALDTQTNPPSWGLDRIDQRNLPLDNSYTFTTTASNVHAYIIDTGIRITHTTFGGRATWGHNSVDTNNTDCNGHGTHVAGTVGGSQYGVAKGVSLVAVKVLNCSGSGTTAQVADGINWVAANAIHPAVANMSLGGGADPTLDNAVSAAINSGVTFAIASGNSNADACNFSPARVPSAITVNATDINDARASFSNFGTCTDIFAPGVNITSAWMTDDNATNTISGTSMATPHVTGAAALWLADHPGDTPGQVTAGLVNASTTNKVTNPGSGSPNRLLFTLFGVPGGVSVTNPGSRSGTVGTAITSFTLTASGGTPPYTWSATGLPPGLSIGTSTGTVSGTPTTAGTFTVTATATDTAAVSGSTTFTFTISPSGGGCSSPGQKLGNPGFESGSAPWTATAGVIGAFAGQVPHSGTRFAWLDGYGTTHTDTLSQAVSIPAGCTSYVLTFWLHIDTAEAPGTAYDRLTVTIGSTTVATYTNLNSAAGYTQKSFNVSAFAGQTPTLTFRGTEDFSLQTSFVIDDTALTVS
jgi:subtilisin family serine protease